MEEVVLVDEQDRVVATEEKLRAHRDGGKLHRAFSILICDSRGRMLLQLRSRQKYHFGGLWTNACCGHPRPGEPLDQAAHRRLREELGFDTPLREIFSFIYQAGDPQSALTEYEFDHVFFGVFEGTPRPDPAEADDFQWVEPDAIGRDLEDHPERYTPWFPLVWAQAVAHVPMRSEWGIGERTNPPPIAPGVAGPLGNPRRASAERERTEDQARDDEP